MTQSRSTNTPASTDDTRTRLLDAAERLFPEQGYDRTSVREITQAADCNVASINYHFGDKHGLFVAMFRRLIDRLREYRISRVREAVARPGADLEAVVRVFCVSFMEPLIEDSRSRLTMQLMMQEMLSPRLPQGMLWEELFQPTMDAMGRAMQKVCPKLTIAQTQLFLVSLTGQLVQFLHVWRMSQPGGAAPGNPMSKLTLSDAVEHVLTFSVAGIEAMLGSKDKQPSAARGSDTRGGNGEGNDRRATENL